MLINPSVNPDTYVLAVRIRMKEENIEAMKEKGIEERDIFIDKQSGKDFNRINTSY
ncbi:hypothetical protein QY97_02641 [Bacillus thermotolerans]|nr:hypothetical protein QY97_02641 [Bacillus thermotolerans]